jgi:predicted GH43/DUF377 family glycosyl hydrolase
MTGHAFLPTLLRRPEGWRLYFSGRDDEGRSRLGFAELDLRGRPAVVRVGPRPLLEPGPVGAFDDHGVSASWITEHEGRLYLYYIGWNLGVTVPFYTAVGLALSDDGGESWRRFSEGPIIDRDPVDPYHVGSVCVLVEDGLWRMWYLSGRGWRIEDRRPRHYYHIRYGESADGITWRRTGRVCIDFRSPDEYAIARPCVVRDGGRYLMWYCYRGDAYRIGYAESPDGLTWERKDDHRGLAASGEGWDSEMTAYPFVFDEGGRRYMAYNGNGYGRTGVGLAVLEPETRGARG